MAINTTGNNGSVVGVTGVHPDNIGKGIKWNDTTKKYEVDVKEDSGIIINELGELEIRVSELEDNALRVIDGKLYYGTRARPELANLYVDAVNGVDQDPLKVDGAGTRAKPLKTLRYALDRAEANSNRAVWLMGNQEHVFDCSTMLYLKAGQVSIQTYGADYDVLMQQYTNNFVSQEQLVKQNKAATLKFTGIRHSLYSAQKTNLYAFSGINIDANTSVVFQGLHIKNNIQYTLEPSSATSSLVSDYCRVRSINGGIADFTNVSYESEGELTFTGATDNRLASKHPNGLERTGLVWCYKGMIVLRNILNFNPANVKDNFIADAGWNPATLPVTTIVYAKDSGQASNREFTKRLLGFKIDSTPNGDKFISSPVTDLLPQMLL